MSDRDLITLYSDGACENNPGPGGWAVVLRSGTREKRLSGGFRRTTNNRMELRAVIEGLKTLKRSGLSVKVVSDSQYVTEAVTQGWLEKWAAKQFKKSGGLREPWCQWRYARHQQSCRRTCKLHGWRNGLIRDYV